MRAADVTAALVSRIEALSVDAPAHVPFRHVDAKGGDLTNVGPRVFTLEVSGKPTTKPGFSAAADLYAGSWDLVVRYPASEGVEAWIARDSERLTKSLRAAHTADSDLYLVEVAESGVSKGEQLLEATYSLGCTYRLTGV